MFDVFEIDVNSFATVLEYCRGTDLDERLKRNKTLPEKDAKTILLQVCITSTLTCLFNFPRVIEVIFYRYYLV